MRSLLQALAFSSALLAILPSTGRAQVFEITSLTGSIEGHAYSTIYDNGQYLRYGKEYANELSPTNGNTISASINEGMYSNITSRASLTVAATASGISFDSRAYAYSTPMGDPRLYMQEKLASTDLLIIFTVAAPTLMELTFDFLRQPYNQAIYDFYRDNYYGSGVELSLARFENGRFVTENHQSATWDAFDTYGEDDGVFHASTLLPGVEYALNIQSWATQGNAVANGALNFSPLTVPVPEPAGALLLIFGLTLLTPRSRRLTTP
ncbi:MAG: hypothetical protein ACO1TE_07470 [Prosthecobacter sp.]